MNALPWIAATLVGSAVVFLLWRGAIVLALLLVASQFLGWADPSSLEIAGAFDVHAAIMVIVIVAITFGLARGWVRNTNFGMPMTVLGALWMMGLLLPVLRGDSTLWLALNASKEFMVLFAYFAVVLFMRSERDLRTGWTVLLVVAGYYCAIELLAQFMGRSLIQHMAVDHRQDAFGLWKLYLRFWPVILVLLFYSIFEYCQGRRSAILPMLLGMVGLLLTFFRSYLLASFVVVGLLVLLIRAARQSPRAVTELTVLGVFAVGVAALLAGQAFMDAGDSFMFSGLREMRDQTGGALAGRRAYAEMLFELASQRPLFGFGFVERDSALVQAMSLPMFAGASLGFVDAGWADVLVKFGFVGGVLLLLTYLWIFKRALSLARHTDSAVVRTRALTAAALVLVYIIVLPVHAPLTHSFGLLPLALVLGIVDGEAQNSMNVVLHVTETLERHGGTPRKLLYLVQHGDATQLRHSFVTFVPGNLDTEMRGNGATVRCAGSSNVGTVTRCVYEAARRENADVICTHFTRALVCGVTVAGILRVPVIHNAHGPAAAQPPTGLMGSLGRMASHWSFPATSLVTANSRFTATTLRETFAVPDHKLRVIPNPVISRESSATGAAPGIPPRAPGRLRMVQVGGLIPVRRQHLLLDGLAALLRGGVDAELLMVGDGPLKDKLIAQAQGLGIAARVHWLGFRDDIGAVFAGSDVYVSAIDSEGFGIAVVEAMLHGIPVVLANGGAYPELVDDGRFGLLFDSRDAQDLAGKVASLSADGSLRTRLVAAAREHAVQSYTPRRYAERYQALVAEVCRS